MLLEELLQRFGSVDEETIELAQGAVTALLSIGLERDAALAWIDQGCAQPDRFLDDPVLGPLAGARLRSQVVSPQGHERRQQIGVNGAAPLEQGHHDTSCRATFCCGRHRRESREIGRSNRR